MEGADKLKPGQAHRRVVKLKDWDSLNRYWDDAATPRPEGSKKMLPWQNVLAETSKRCIEISVPGQKVELILATGGLLIRKTSPRLRS